MGAIGNPKTWIPYINSRECSKQICTLSCPQWCYIIFTPPPPPPPLLFDDKPQNRITFSPLVIAIIGILASALLLVSYYAIVSKYCGNSRPSTTIEEGQPSNEEIVDEGNNNNNNNNNTNYNESNEFLQYEPWFISTNGLDEALIKSITMVKYKKGEGLVDSVDCLVCLGEFIEGDYLRLLPKCTHAFHVNCIDTWLKSHSTCPLCRANVVSVFVSHIQPASTLVVDTNGNDNNNQGQVIVSLLDNNHVGNEEMSSSREGGMSLLKCPFRSFSHLARLELRHNEHVPNDYKDGFGRNDVTRRSISMDNFNETSVSISDIWRLSHRKDHQGERFGNCSTSS